MSKLRTLALTLTLALFTASPAFAQEFFQIQNFHADINIHENSSFTVNEEIEVEFSQPRHGIFREILLEEDIDIEILGVTNEKGEDRPYQVSDLGDRLEVKIGDPVRYVDGQQTYEINYNVYNAVRNYEDVDNIFEGAESYDELFWNVNGTDWPVDAQKVSATIDLPQSLFGSDQAFIYQCYTGYYGSENEDCSYQKKGNTVEFNANGKLYSYQGLTLALGLPPGHLATPSEIILETSPKKADALVNGDYKCKSDCKLYLGVGQNTLTFEKWGYQTAEEKIEVGASEHITKQVDLKALFWFKILQTLFLLLILVIIANPLYAFLKKGRDPKGRGTIIPQYEAPKGMKPAEMGTLYDEKVHMHDLTSTLIDLCVRGYMKIKVLLKEKGLFKKEDYEFIRTNNKEGWDAGLSELERLFMKRIFKNSGHRKLSSLKNEFYKHLPQLKKMLYKDLVKKGYMPKEPDKVRSNYLVKAFLLFFVGAMGSGVLIAFQVDLFWLLMGAAFVLNGLQTLIFSFFMPQKTKKGRLAYEHVLGFKMYLETAEKDRVQFQEKENLFYQFLPYAMTLKIADKWSKAFKDLYKTPPDWYMGDQEEQFNFHHFSRSMTSMSQQMGQTFSSQPSSSGSGGSGFSGGSSGGGFGGGGGGSW